MYKLLFSIAGIKVVSHLVNCYSRLEAAMRRERPHCTLIGSDVQRRGGRRCTRVQVFRVDTEGRAHRHQAWHKPVSGQS
jgi:hypothetical protein